jgi:hypothetical protein
MALMPVDEALARILDGAAASDETEMLGLADSGGRVLARDLLALRTQPPFSASAMDGYAVRASEAVTGAKLRLQGESAAGHGFDAPLAPGSTIRIFTGAPVPEGADTVLIQENTERLEDGLVLVTQAPEAGRNIRPAGVDFTEGRTGLARGRLLDAGAITLAAAMNHADTARDPLSRKIAILATGDELRLPGQTLGPRPDRRLQHIRRRRPGPRRGRRRHRPGHRRRPAGRARRRAGYGARARASDVLVTIGGASVGDHDLVQKALDGARHGARFLENRDAPRQAADVRAARRQVARAWGCRATRRRAWSAPTCSSSRWSAAWPAGRTRTGYASEPRLLTKELARKRSAPGLPARRPRDRLPPAALDRHPAFGAAGLLADDGLRRRPLPDSSGRLSRPPAKAGSACEVLVLRD